MAVPVMKRQSSSNQTCYPLTPDRWQDFERLFGPRGAYSGCWCMWWRLARSEFEQQQGDGNRKAIRKLTRKDPAPGLLLYEGDEPIGWVSVSPREQYSSLERSRVLKRIDDKAVWSIVCFFVAKSHRHEGVIREVVDAAIEHVKKEGGKIIEAYPTRPRGKELPPVSSFMGLPAVFEKAGFVECKQPSEAKVIMRYYL